MASSTDICNMALLHLGQRTIASLGEASANGRACTLFYPQCRDFVLRDAPWSFASRTTNGALAALTDAEKIPGWLNVFALPSLCLRPLKIFGDGEPPRRSPHRFEVLASPVSQAPALYCDLDAPFLRFIAQISDTTLFDPDFIKALSYQLASELAIPLCAKAQLSEQMRGYYERAIGEAKRKNAEAANPKRPEGSSYEDAR